MMKTKNRIRIAGIILIILGCIHIAATPFIILMFRVLGKTGLLTFAYMFVCTGIALVFIGWLQYYIARQPDIDKRGNDILSMSAWLMLFIGSGAVITMYDNPFAYIALLVALFDLYQVRTLSYLIKNQTDKVVS